MVVVGDEGCAEEEDDVDDGSRHHVEPEHGVVILMGGVGLVDECRLETAALQFVGDEREDADHGYHAIIVGGEQSAEDDADHQPYQLLHAVVHAAPE